MTAPEPSVIVVGDGAIDPAIAAAAEALGLAIYPVGEAGAAVRMIETGAGGEVAAIVLAPGAQAPIAAARRIHAAAPLIQLVFVIDDAGGGSLRRELALAPRIGTGWSSASADSEAVTAALEDAARSTRQRQQMRTTLQRARTQLAPDRRVPPPGTGSAAIAPVAAERRRIARLEVTQALIAEPDLAGAAPRILAALGAGLGWSCAILWMLDAAVGRLRCSELWRTDPSALVAFATASLETTFAPGEGRPGRAWAERRAVVVDDVVADPGEVRAAAAARDGIRTAYFQPIVLGSEVLGVIELAGRERLAIDPDVVELMASAASAIAQLADRSRIEAALRRHNDELVAADRRKNELIALIAHELRNPLAPICDAVRLVQDPATTGAERDHGLLVIDRHVATLSRLVDDLLDVSRVATGTLQLRTEPVAVADVITRAVDTVRPGIERHGLTLTVAVPGEPMWMVADRVRIEQVLTNLLVNAGKYTDRGGRIWLTAAPVGPVDAGRRVVIAVRDTGIGIPDDLRPRVFDMFAQPPGAFTRDRGGLGIGLTLVKRLVELHGGEVAVSSAGVNKGSEFSVRLPLVDPGLAQAI